jgi:hypothetical protein
MYFGKYRHYIAGLARRFKFGPLKEAYESFTEPHEDEQAPNLSNASL